MVSAGAAVGAGIAAVGATAAVVGAGIAAVGAGIAAVGAAGAVVGATAAVVGAGSVVVSSSVPHASAATSAIDTNITSNSLNFITFPHFTFPELQNATGHYNERFSAVKT